MDGGGVFADPRGVGAGAFGSKLAPAFGEETRTGSRERHFDVFWHLAGEEPGGEERALGEDVDDALPPDIFEGFEVYPLPGKVSCANPELRPQRRQRVPLARGPVPGGRSAFPAANGPRP